MATVATHKIVGFALVVEDESGKYAVYSDDVLHSELLIRTETTPLVADDQNIDYVTRTIIGEFKAVFRRVAIVQESRELEARIEQRMQPKQLEAK